LNVKIIRNGGFFFTRKWYFECALTANTINNNKL
jgi:hypothetical protein